MGMNRSFWHGKRVFLTGHTGFKGGWLALWLNDMGAQVYGYALNPPSGPNLYNVAEVEKALTISNISNICDAVQLVEFVQKWQPDVVFHMAAQSLVRYSYEEPVETYAVNVMGTVNILEAVKQTSSIKAVVNVTTDKCYENREWNWAYRENEAMGGHDPYSSSKGCSELVTAAYRRSFLDPIGVHVATARAGNVIGGGDWAADRLIPDYFRALDANLVFNIRSPQAIRPWQHVLEPLSGYLILAEKLYSEGRRYADAWNFGPDDADMRSVEWIVEYLSRLESNVCWENKSQSQFHESGILKLDSSQAKSMLGWHPRWNLELALDKTIEWHKKWKSRANMFDFCIDQIHEYEASIN